MSDTGFVREKPEGYVFGRPTSYRPDYCELVIALGSEGKSKTEIAFEIGVVRQTLDDWASKHPDFSNALTRAKQAEQAWWERQGRTNLTAQIFQASMWSRSMAARFPEDWREKVGHVGGNKDDEPIKTETTHIGLDEFARRIASIAARTAEVGGNEPADGGTTG